MKLQKILRTSLMLTIPLLGNNAHALDVGGINYAVTTINLVLNNAIQFFSDLSAALHAIDPNATLQPQSNGIVATVLGTPYLITGFIGTTSIGVQGPRLDVINGVVYFTDSLGNCSIIQLG